MEEALDAQVNGDNRRVTGWSVLNKGSRVVEMSVEGAIKMVAVVQQQRLHN